MELFIFARFHVLGGHEAAVVALIDRPLDLTRARALE
jgi:hypothetical protein